MNKIISHIPKSKKNYSRREFLSCAGLVAIGTSLNLKGIAEIPGIKKEPIIDIHQHTDYNGRTNEQLLAHQRAMGVTTTILLPSWRPEGPLSGKERWKTTGNEACYQFSKRYPGEFRYGANAVPSVPDMMVEIEKYLKLGAVIIGELKFAVECDSPEMQKLYQLAEVYNVPVLMHWLYKRYNYGFERFYKMLEKYPKVNFIGHAQTWWANIDKNHTDQSKTSVNELQGPVTPGGITDRYLSDYPNMYGDLSAGSGLNALTRDEDYAKAFLERHQDKLFFGSDCEDRSGVNCSGAQHIIMIRKLAASKKIERKLLYENAKKLLRL